MVRTRRRNATIAVAAWIALASSLAQASCKRATEAPTHRATDARTTLNAVDASAHGEANPGTAQPKAERRFLLGGSEVCVRTAGKGIACAQPTEVGDDGGAHTALTFRARPGTETVAEFAPREHCARTENGEVTCDGQPIAKGVKSIAAAPYFLANDGTVSAPLDSSRGNEAALRRAAVRAVPKMKSLVATEYGTCGLGEANDVWCWSDPFFAFGEPSQVGAATGAVRVPGIDDAVDITLMPWLTLCVRTRAGGVFCSAAPARATEVCVLRGTSDVRCGTTTGGPKGPPTLEGPGYDPRHVLDKKLVAVPGFDGENVAKSLHAFARLAYSSAESSRRIFVSDLDEGGCAEIASGGVRCWERDTCGAGSPWQSARVEGLPKTFVRMVLGANDGYVWTREGTLFTWPRRVDRRAPTDECATRPKLAFHAERVALPGGVVDVGGTTAILANLPMFAAVDCASLESGEVTCWRTDRRAREPVRVTFLEGDASPRP